MREGASKMARTQELNTRNQGRKKRKKIDTDLQVSIANNTYGGFSYKFNRTGTIISLAEQGDDEVVTYGELREIRKYIQNMDLIITEVFDDNISIYDVAQGLRADKTYDVIFGTILGEDKEDYDLVDNIVPEDIEDFIVNGDINNFEEALNSVIRNSLIMATVALRRENKVTDARKLDLIVKTRPVDEQQTFWSDIAVLD